MRYVLRLVLTALGLLLAAPLGTSALAHVLGSRWTHSAATRCHRGAACPSPSGQRAEAPKRHHPYFRPVQLRISAGYAGAFRPSAWLPVRVTLANRTADVLRGTAVIPDTGGNTRFSTPDYAALYDTPVVLPAHTTKRITVYLPGSDVDAVTVRFQVQNRVVASGSMIPDLLDDQTVSVGVLAPDRQLIDWIHHVRLPGTHLAVLSVPAANVDSVPQALASLDTIVISDTDTSVLNRLQLSALEAYVRNGGSLVLVGGPDSQESLRPLPAALVPGRLSGTTATAIHPFRVFDETITLRGHTALSILSHPRGDVLARQAGIPLVVRDPLGKGQITYLAFDPARSGLTENAATHHVLSSVVKPSTVPALNRLAMTQQPRRFFRARFGPTMMRDELDNVPAGSSPLALVLILLAGASIVLIGPVNFFVLHLLHRRELAWFSIPALTIGCFAGTLGLTSRLHGNVAVVNTVSFVNMGRADSAANGSAALSSPISHAASVYLSLSAPLRDKYQLTWHGTALPQSLPSYSFGQGPSNTLPVGVRFREGGQTAIEFPSVGASSSRSVALQTSVKIAGQIHADLFVAPDGTIAGTIRNDTNLALAHPAIIAGSTFERLGNLPPSGMQQVHIRPAADGRTDTGSVIWDQIYGSDNAGGFGSWDGDPWEQPPPAPEKSVVDRLRNVAERLPEARTITQTYNLFFAGWSTASLGSVTVNGAQPQHRDLDLIVAPISVSFHPGPFKLLPGTVIPELVDASIKQTQLQGGCCFGFGGFFGQSSMTVGVGDHATFQFRFPAGQAIRLQRLFLSVSTGNGDTTHITSVYDWSARQWVHIPLPATQAALPRPARFISSSGALLVRLQPTNSSGDVIVTDPHQDVQIFGSGSVG